MDMLAEMVPWTAWCEHVLPFRVPNGITMILTLTPLRRGGEVLNISIAEAPNVRKVFFDDTQELAGFFGEYELVQALSNVNQLVCSPDLEIISNLLVSWFSDQNTRIISPILCAALVVKLEVRFFECIQTRWPLFKE